MKAAKTRGRNPQLAARLHDLVNVYAIDLPDPTAAEVLLIVEEVLKILGLDAARRSAIFGPRVVAYLQQWDTELGPTPGVGPVSLSPWTGRMRPTGCAHALPPIKSGQRRES